MKMVLKTLSVGELRSPNSTARQHNRNLRKKARALFSEHGIVVPIIVDERMQIIDSILRFEIAKELGLQELSARYCQTNEPKHQYSFDEYFYEVTNERHSVRAASRFSLNVLRFESDFCELNKL